MIKIPEKLLITAGLKKSTQSFFLIKAGIEGKVAETDGNSAFFFNDEICVGDELKNIPVFSSFFPLKQKRYFIPNIQTNDQVWANLFFEKLEDHVLVLLVDQSEKAKELKKKVQDSNQKALNKKD